MPLLNTSAQGPDQLSSQGGDQRNLTQAMMVKLLGDRRIKVEHEFHSGL